MGGDDTAGKAARRRRVALGIAAFVIGMHAVAYFVVGGFAAAVIDKHFLIAVTATILLSWLLMVSQAMESVARAFSTRADLDLILASPVAAQRLFAMRIATVALAVAAMALPLAGPFINMLGFLGGWHWLGAYGVILAMGAAATAVAVVLTVALFRIIGPKRTRLTAQVLAAIIGAAFVIGLQVAAILSYGTLSRADVLQSQTLEALAPRSYQRVLVAGARRARRYPLAFRRAGRELCSARRRDCARRAALRRLCHRGVRRRRFARRAHPPGKKLPASPPPRAALRRKEWLLLRRDPWLASQTLMQMLYLLPPAILLWRTFEAGGGALNLRRLCLVMAAGQLAGGLAWLTIAGEDAPDLVATAPIPQRYVLRAKIEAVIAIIAVIFAPLVAVIAIASPWHAAITGAGIVIAAALRHRDPALVPHARRSAANSAAGQVSSRVATFAEAFSPHRLGRHRRRRRCKSAARHPAGPDRARRRRRHPPAGAARRRLRLLRLPASQCGAAMSSLPQRHQQDHDLADLLQGAGHIAGLSADLAQAHHRMAPSTTSNNKNATTDLATPRLTSSTTKPSSTARAALLCVGRPAPAERPSGRAGGTSRRNSGTMARAPAFAAIKASVAGPGPARLASVPTRSRSDIASAQAP